MDIDLVFKIAAVGIVVAVLNQLLVRSDRPDQAMLVSLAGLITTMMLLVREISSLFRSHQEPVWVLGWSCSSSLRR